jgi:hypothetical protein
MKNKSVIFNNEEYFKIIKFDCNVVDLSYKEGGGYFTVLPVSTHSKVEINKDNNRTTFIITDDWGKVHVMLIPNFMNEEIATAIKSAEKINQAFKP